MNGELPRAVPASIRRTDLASLLPPVRDWRFWVVQALIGMIFLVHQLLAGELGMAPVHAVPSMAVEGLYLVPILYAALNFSLVGSLATAASVALIMVLELALRLHSFHQVPSLDKWAHLTVFGVLFSTSIFVGRRMEKEHRARQRAEEAMRGWEKAEKRAAFYAAHVVKGQEDERRRIAQELHDDPVQELANICYRADALLEYDEVNGEVAAGVQRIRDMASSVAKNLRTMAAGLRPPGLDDLGLVAMARQLVNDLRSHSSIIASFEVSGSARRLPPELELCFYRVVQEALRNVAKHACAGQVDVVLDFLDDRARLRVVDDGIGFVAPTLGNDSPLASSDASYADSGLGLLGISERVSMLGGRFGVRSMPGEGTVIEAEVPLLTPASAGTTWGCLTSSRSHHHHDDKVRL